MKISAVIITFNEEKNIGNCIESVLGLADEIVVVDSFSSDKTEMICRERGAKFIQHKFKGHIEQKNFAVSQANNDWVLSLDADERLSDELKNSITARFSQSGITADAFKMNRLNNYCGKWIKHGIWYPDKKIRLWNKQKGSWGGVNPHDEVVMDPESKTIFLKGDILHYTVATPEEYFSQQKKFGEISRDERIKRGEKSVVPVFLRTSFAFTRSYIFRLGLLDGKAGYEIAKGFALATKQKYI